MVRKKSDIILLIIFIIFVLIIFLYIFAYRVAVENIIASFIVSDVSGFDLNSTALTFGKVQHGQAASRALFVNNTNKYSVRVRINVKGNISKHLIASENDFYLAPFETQKIMFSINVPEGLEQGVYSGEVKVILTRF